MRAYILGYISQPRRKRSFGNSWLATRQKEVYAKINVPESLGFRCEYPYTQGQKVLIQNDLLAIGRGI
jgi:hypothetical protein